MAKYRKLGRTSSQRKALIRNQVTALLHNGKIVTTEAKAKEIRKVAEGLIALAVKEKDNYEEVTVKAKVARKDKDGKRVKANIITIGGKEYDCGKIGRKKYKAFREVYERLTRPEKQTYTDAELDEMINTIVLVYDNQFTFEEANESLEDVSEIIFNFGLINANILKKLKDEAAGAKKNLSSQV